MASKLTAIVGVISMLGAILGGIVAGFVSDRQGRRRTMIAAMLFALLLIPVWVFSHGLALISVGAFLMQFMVQGAWGVIPAHITELVPGKARALLPGLAYQLGVLFASRAPTLEAQATHYFSYGQAMAGTLVIVVLIGVVVIGAGPEARHVDARDETPGNIRISSRYFCRISHRMLLEQFSFMKYHIQHPSISENKRVYRARLFLF